MQVTSGFSYGQIGINYTGKLHQLNGCINDVLRTRQFLIGAVAIHCEKHDR